MARKVEVKSFAKYNGHNIRSNSSIDVGMVFEYSELPNYIKLIQMLNENVEIVTKVGTDPAQLIGTFMIKEIKVDHDGQGIVKFNSLMDHVEADTINGLVGQQFKVRFKATAEDAEEDEE